MWGYRVGKEDLPSQLLQSCQVDKKGLNQQGGHPGCPVEEDRALIHLKESENSSEQPINARS